MPEVDLLSGLVKQFGSLGVLLFVFFWKIWPWFTKDYLPGQWSREDKRNSDYQRTLDAISNTLIEQKAALMQIGEIQSKMASEASQARQYFDGRLDVLYTNQTALLAILGDQDVLRLIREHVKRSTSEMKAVSDK